MLTEETRKFRNWEDAKAYADEINRLANAIAEIQTGEPYIDLRDRLTKWSYKVYVVRA